MRPIRPADGNAPRRSPRAKSEDGVPTAWRRLGARLPVIAGEIPPGEDRAPASLLRLLAAIDDEATGDPRRLRPGQGLGEALERGEGLAGRSLGGLDLHQHEIAPPLQNQVDLQAAP